MGYRVIIADDEPKLLMLIKQLGHWEEYGIEIVDECYDGKSTLESIRKNRPDFVLSDIKMPDLDGIELMEAARKEGIESLFVLISGYRHFEYARSAIALNVVDYLLKPIDEEQLNKTLDKVCKQIAQNRENVQGREELTQIKEQLKRDKMERFWSDFVDRQRRESVTANTVSREICNARYHTAFEKECYQVMMVSSNMSGIFAQQNSLFEDQMEHLIRKYFKGWSIYYYHMTYRGCIIVLNYAMEDRKRTKENISALYYGIRDLGEIYGDFIWNIGVSGAKDSIRDLQRAFSEAEAAEWGRFIIMRSGVLDYAQISGLKNVGRKEIISDGELDKIGSCVKYLRREELGEVFQRLHAKAGICANCFPGDLAAVFGSIVDAVCGNVREECRVQMMVQCDYAYLEARNFAQLIKNLYGKLDDYMKEEQRKIKQKTGKPISEAVRYIRENYAKAVSQEEVADKCNISTAYLSKLFKEELGIGFTEYLTKVRLEESEKLLADTTLTIKEVAVTVGYPDEKYYSRLFKKNTGIKPTEYRRIYG